MQTRMRTWAVVAVVVLGLVVLTGVVSSVEAVLTIKSAEVQNGVAVVKGSDAARGALIYWEDGLVTQAKPDGGFAFQGVVPADCVGSLHAGDPTVAITVALAQCTPVSEAPAPVPQTGQTQCSDASGTLIPCLDTGQDGEFQAGVAWPVPRFTDRGDGTVRDNLTGLIWLKNAECFGARSWTQALTDANTLASPTCGLSDGSVAGDWRLPNVKELQSLIDFGFYGPALCNAAGTGRWTEGDAFSRVEFTNYNYWSSSTYVSSVTGGGHLAWYVNLFFGITNGKEKTASYVVWPVRGGP